MSSGMSEEGKGKDNFAEYFPELRLLVKLVLDKHGIVGGRRLDYHNFARKYWSKLLKRGEKTAERFLKALWIYSTEYLELDKEILKELVEVVKKHVESIHSRRKKQEVET